MSIARLAAFIADEPDFDVRWRLVVEFLKEYHREPAGDRQWLLADMPEPVGDERWDVLFAGLAEHLAMRDGQGAPPWSALRGLRRFWFPFDTPGARAGARPCPGSLPQARRVRCRLRNRRGMNDPSPLLDRAALEDAFRRRARLAWIPEDDYALGELHAHDWAKPYHRPAWPPFQVHIDSYYIFH